MTVGGRQGSTFVKVMSKMALIGITSNIPFQIFKSDKVLLLLSSCWKMTLIRRARDYYTLYLKL